MEGKENQGHPSNFTISREPNTARSPPTVTIYRLGRNSMEHLQIDVQTVRPTVEHFFLRKTVAVHICLGFSADGNVREVRVAEEFHCCRAYKKRTL